MRVLQLIVEHCIDVKFNSALCFSFVISKSYWRLYCADLNSKSVATWLPSIYYNRQQHLLKNVLEKTGTTGTALGDNSPELNDSRKRKRSMWSKQQRGLRRGSYDVLAGRPESLAGNLPRKSSTCSALDSDFFGESFCWLHLSIHAWHENMIKFGIKHNTVGHQTFKICGLVGQDMAIIHSHCTVEGEG